MNIVLNSQKRTLISFTPDEMIGICNALNELCNDRQFSESEFQTRLGVTRNFLVGVLAQMPSKANSQQGDIERTAVWADQGSVQILCVSAYGDPVDLSTVEAVEFAKQLQGAIEKAT